MTKSEEARTLGAIRSYLFILTVLALLGTETELLLMGHTKNIAQWIPIFFLGVAIVATAGHAIVRTTSSLTVFRGSMGFLVIFGCDGFLQHYAANFGTARDVQHSQHSLRA